VDFVVAKLVIRRSHNDRSRVFMSIGVEDVSSVMPNSTETEMMMMRMTQGERKLKPKAAPDPTRVKKQNHFTCVAAKNGSLHFSKTSFGKAW